jgi:hypothetical protein
MGPKFALRNITRRLPVNCAESSAVQLFVVGDGQGLLTSSGFNPSQLDMATPL